MATAIEAPATMQAEGPTSHTQNQLEALAKLREPFETHQVSKLPKIWCGKCNKAPYKVCDDHTRARCDMCASTLTTGHLHLDYVGHAELTGRLLDADPLWTWEPMAFDADGLPKFDQHGGLWIRLTVAGLPRIGYGDAQGKTGPNAVKEAIGDALRNAGMRFGAALTLWSKTDMDEAYMQRQSLAVEPSREDRLEELYALMQKRWGHLEGLRTLKTLVGGENFHESQVQDMNGQMRLFGELIDERIVTLARQAKLEDFLRRMRNGWDGITTNEQSLAEARTKGFLGDLIPFGEQKTPTRIEDMLTGRIKELKEKAAQVTAETGGAVRVGNAVIDRDCFVPHPDGQDFANQAALATSREAVESLRSTAEAQGIASSGVLAPDSGEPDVLADYLGRRIAELPADGEESVLDGFLRRMRNGWNNLETTKMALAEAKQKGINDVVPFDGDHLHIQDVLEIRIKALEEKAAHGGDTGRSAA